MNSTPPAKLPPFPEWAMVPARTAAERNLIKLGINRATVHKASRSRKGPWRMSQNSLVRVAMTNQWLDQQGVPSIENQWINIALASARPFGLPLAG